MRKCVCGEAIEDGGVLCAECGALHELGLGAGASLDEVKAAYKTLVKVWHPDRFQGDEKLTRAAEVKLKAINTAYRHFSASGYEDGGASKSGASQKPGAGEGAGAGAAGDGGFGFGVGGQRATAEEAAEREEPERPVDVRVYPARRNGSGFGRRVGIRALVALVLLGIGAVLLSFADSYLAADTRVGRYYVGFKSQLRSDFDAAKGRTWGELKEKAHGLFGGSLGSAPVATLVSEQATTTSAPESSAEKSGEGHAAKREPAEPLKLLPYVTVGLTREEVISAQGGPTSASDEKLIYGASELDLKDGKVVGWRIDSRSPLRVKLWPEGPVDTSLRSFTVGSTKDEVLVVQGTPSSFTPDRFEYGSSVVYFRENRVLVWRDGSVRLRAEE